MTVSWNGLEGGTDFCIFVIFWVFRGFVSHTCSYGS